MSPQSRSSVNSSVIPATTVGEFSINSSATRVFSAAAADIVSGDATIPLSARTASMTSRVLQPANGGYLKSVNPEILLQHFFECGAVTRGRVHQHPVHIEDDRGERGLCAWNPRSSHHYSVAVRLRDAGSRSVTKHWTLDKTAVPPGTEE